MAVKNTVAIGGAPAVPTARETGGPAKSGGDIAADLVARFSSEKKKPWGQSGTQQTIDAAGAAAIVSELQKLPKAQQAEVLNAISGHQVLADPAAAKALSDAAKDAGFTSTVQPLARFSVGDQLPTRRTDGKPELGNAFDPPETRIPHGANTIDFLLDRDATKVGNQLRLDGNGARNLIVDLQKSQQQDPTRIELIKDLARRDNVVLNADAAKALGGYAATLKGFEGERLPFSTVGSGEFKRFSVRPDGQLFDADREQRENAAFSNRWT